MRLSIIIVSPNSNALLATCLDSLAAQRTDANSEVVVVSNRTGASVLAPRFPDVQFIEACPGTTIPELRTIGIAHSSGDIVALAEDHGYFGDGWIAAISAAHAAGHEVVGGAVENDRNQGALDWAVYFYDYARYMLPHDAGFVSALSGNNVSYGRSLLDAEAERLNSGLYEAFLHERLRERGQSLYFAPEAVVFHNKHYELGRALSQCFHFGRSYGGMRVAGAPLAKRGIFALAALGLPALLPLRVVVRTFRKQRHRVQLLRSLPHLVLLMCGWGAGELTGYLMGEGESRRHWS